MIRRVLVTGGNGFIGSRLTGRLLEHGDLHVTATYREARHRLPAENGESLRCIHLDVSDRAEVERVFREYDFDTVVHTAAVVSGANDEESMHTALGQNLLGTANLMVESRRSGCRLFLFCSSTNVYGDIFLSETESTWQGVTEETKPKPSTYYGWSKLASEELLRIHAESGPMRGISLRLGGTHGPGRKSGVVYHMFDRARRGEPITIMESMSRFRFLFLEDAVEAIVVCLLAEVKGNYRCYNVASEEVLSLVELGRRIIDWSGSDSRLEISDHRKARNQVWSIDRIRSETGFRPKPLKEHLEQMGQYIRLDSDSYREKEA